MIDEDRTKWTLGQLADEVIEVCELPMGCRGTIIAALNDAKLQGRADVTSDVHGTAPTFERHAEWLKRKMALQGDLDEPAAMGGDLSCLCCGQMRGPAKVWLIDHPEVYVCAPCHAAAVPPPTNSGELKARPVADGYDLVPPPARGTT